MTYRITVEAIDKEKSTLSSDFPKIECNGFLIIGRVHGGGCVFGTTIAIHEMEAIDIASAIASHDVLFENACFAKRLRDECCDKEVKRHDN